MPKFMTIKFLGFFLVNMFEQNSSIFQSKFCSTLWRLCFRVSEMSYVHLRDPGIVYFKVLVVYVLSTTIVLHYLKQ